MGDNLAMLTPEEIERIAERVVARLSGPAAIKPRLLTIEDAGRYLGRTPGAIRTLEFRGQLPAIRADSRIMFDIRDLDAWIDRNRQQREV